MIKNSGLLALLFTAICLGGYSSLLSHRLELARQQSAEQQKTLAQQAGLIATLQTQDAQNRALTAVQQQQEQQLRQRGEIYQRKLRDALKGDKCGNSTMPPAIIELLRGSAANGGTKTSRVVPSGVGIPALRTTDPDGADLGRWGNLHIGTANGPWSVLRAG